MEINFYKYSNLSKKDQLKLLKRSESDVSKITDVVKKIITEIKSEGDVAISRHIKKIDKVDVSENDIKVNENEIKSACQRLPKEIKQAIDHAIKNISTFHKSLMPKDWSNNFSQVITEIEPGVMAGEKVTPLDSVGLYIPRGKGSFPSVMCMLCVPAMIAGVKDIAVCTPPDQNGNVDDASLYTADKIGIKNIYKVGGASAIASLAFGTKTIPKVVKVVGPGNQYSVAAKRLLSDVIDVGLPAGPSESIILSDGSVDEKKVVLDLLIEAEHGPDSSAYLVTHNEQLANNACKLLPKYIKMLPEPRQEFCTTVFSKGGYGGIILTNSLKESFEFTNQYAPEHLELLIEDALEQSKKIVNAGEILIGEHTPITLGNYCVGVNAILPTSGFAKTHSCTSVDTFLKRTSLAYCTKEGYSSLKNTAQALAEFEGFPSHANALKKRG